MRMRNKMLVYIKQKKKLNKISRFRDIYFYLKIDFLLFSSIFSSTIYKCRGYFMKKSSFFRWLTLKLGNERRMKKWKRWDIEIKALKKQKRTEKQQQRRKQSYLCFKCLVEKETERKRANHENHWKWLLNLKLNAKFLCSIHCETIYCIKKELQPKERWRKIGLLSMAIAMGGTKLKWYHIIHIQSS